MALFTFVATLPLLSEGAYEPFTSSYQGIADTSGSVYTRAIKGYKPTDGKKHPVFMWLMGTMDDFATEAYMPFAEQMACNGFIAAIPDYAQQDFCLDACADNGSSCSFTLAESNNAAFGIDIFPVQRIGTPEKARSVKKALDVLCAMPEADCSLGVAVSGHSQGAFTTSYLATIDDRLTAIAPLSHGSLDASIDTSCYYGDHIDQFLPQNKRRYIIGENDDLGDLNYSRYTSVDCGGGFHDPVNCLQADGSGYYVIGQEDYSYDEIELLESGAHGPAAHVYFCATDPLEADATLLRGFATGQQPWHMAPTLNWLAKTVTGEEAVCQASVLAEKATPDQPTVSELTCPTAYLKGVYVFGKDRTALFWVIIAFLAICLITISVLLCCFLRKRNVQKKQAVELSKASAKIQTSV